MVHELEARHDPHTIAQVESCDGTQHATHRELTGLRLYYCNCGYNSGWKDVSELPDATDFIREHLPPGVTWPWYPGVPQ